MNDYMEYKHLPQLFLCVCGFVVHVMLLVAFVKDPLKCFRNSATYLVASLAVSDMTVSISLPLADYLERNGFSYLRDFCFVAIMSSFLTIFSISVDRYLMVVHPFKHRSLINGKRMIVWIISIWIIGFGLVFTKRFIKDVTINRLFHAAVEIGLIFLAAFIYAITYASLKKQSKFLTTQDTSANRSLEARILKEKRFLKTIIIVCFVAITTPSPFIILNEVVGKSNSLNTNTMQVIFSSNLLLFTINFVVNPFIYIWRLPKYRKTFSVLYCKCKLC